VLEPVETAGLTLADVPQLRADIRQRIGTARDALRAELASAAQNGRAAYS
jgi:hypothetical protein